MNDAAIVHFGPSVWRLTCLFELPPFCYCFFSELCQVIPVIQIDLYKKLALVVLFVQVFSCTRILHPTVNTSSIRCKKLVDMCPKLRDMIGRLVCGLLTICCLHCLPLLFYYLIQRCLLLWINTAITVKNTATLSLSALLFAILFCKFFVVWTCVKIWCKFKKLVQVSCTRFLTVCHQH